jgi:hypothetical protein
MVLDDPDNPLVLEIRKEAAEAYFGACRKMVDALDTLKAFDDALASSTPKADQGTQRPELLDQAAERVHFVLIQREAMKLPWYDNFFADYGVPPEVMARLGQSRQK